jgi:hypothetical protein
MMMVLRTQYRENYGTAENPFWKNKGGQEFKVKNIPSDLTEEELLEVVDLLLSQIQYENEYQVQYLLNWTLEADDYLSDFEESQLNYDGEILFKEPEIEYGTDQEFFERV